MRYLLLSDIHANILALESVLKHANSRRWDKLISLGDLVGYNTNPNEVVSTIKQLEPIVSVLGNHEELVLLAESDKLETVKSSGIAMQVAKVHLELLSPDNLKYIKSFSEQHIQQDSNWQITHASLKRKWEYIDNLKIARSNAEIMEKNLLLVGHTHVPMLYISVHSQRGDMWRTMALKANKYVYRIPPNASVIFNPGSVGQPRDGIPLASYAIFDEEKQIIEHYRVEYDVMAQQRLILEAGYHEQLARRLSNGR